MNPPLPTISHHTHQERVGFQIADFQSSHLPQGPYSGKPALQLRKRERSLEGPTWSSERHPHLRKEEANSTELKNKSILDPSGKDMTMVYFPRWKCDRKERWVEQRPFDPTVLPRNPVPQYLDEVYIEGFEVTGDLTRKCLEKPEKDFSLSTTLKDTSTTNYKSIRNGLLDQILAQTDSKIYSKSIR